MTNLTIDFRKIAAKTGDQRISFEEFSCQIAQNYDYRVPKGSKAFRIRGEGGDGGVEFYWELPTGSKWGWQAKFVFSLQQLKPQAKKSFLTALETHPTLEKYFICIPFDLTGKTGKGKGEKESYEEFKRELEGLAQKKGKKVEIILEQKFNLLDKLLSFDTSGGRLAFWFDEKLFGKQWFQTHITTTTESMPRYTPDLRVNTVLFKKFMAFTQTRGWDNDLRSKYKNLKDKVYYWGSAIRTKEDSGWGTKFPEALVSNGEESLIIAKQIQSDVEDIILNNKIPSDPKEILDRIDKCLSQLRMLAIEIKKELEKKHGEGALGSANYRQFQAEYMVSFPMANYDHAVELAGLFEEVKEWFNNNYLNLYNSRFMLMTGGWGVGKTYASCDLASIRLENDLGTILLFGDRFSGNAEVWTDICNQIGVTFESKDKLYSALSASAELSGSDLLICIDALNETEPKKYWKSRLRPFLKDIESYQNIKVCVTCRSSYKDYIIENNSDLVEVIHDGFKGVEHQAVNAFFQHYNLVPPVNPIIFPEFSNPLFLKLVCDTLKSKGITYMPNGWQGLNTVIDAFLEEKNKSFGEKFDINKRHCIPEKALKKFVDRAKLLQKPLLSWDEANITAVEAIKEAGLESIIKSSLLDWLIDENLLFIDAQPNGQAEPKEYIRISFERLGDHLLASSILDDPRDIKNRFLQTGDLNHLVKDKEAIEENKGLLEALSIQIPERLDMEFPSIVNESVYQDILIIAITQLHWRDPSKFDFQIVSLIQQGLRTGNSYLVFDELVTCAFLPSQIDAYNLHLTLKRNSMIKRDPFWCGYLYSRYQLENKLVKKILENSFEVFPEKIPYDILLRWCILLSWFCAAADRRIRDKATKALVRLTEHEPKIWIELFDMFLVTDDDYILERVVSACYGVLLRSKDKKIEARIANIIDEKIFGNTGTIQNAVVRDLARSIVQLTLRNKAITKKKLKNNFMPPYASDKKLLETPSDEEFEKAKKEAEDTRLEVSCFHEDFFNYTIDALRSFNHFMSKENIARWIFVNIVKMGFNTDDFNNYDGYIVYNHGGGRGKPVWAERIGKKYQWIWLYRLAGLLSDNIKKGEDSIWDPETPIVPLTYPRGSELDPSVLTKEIKIEDIVENEYLKKYYDINKYKNLSNQDWINLQDDKPSPIKLIYPLDNQDSLLLHGYFDWNDRPEYQDWTKEYRNYWIIVNSYLVKDTDYEAAKKWLTGKNFMNRWMPEGREYHDGFIAEYPWGTQFNLYKETLDLGGKWGDVKLPCFFIPTWSTVYSKAEYDSSGRGNFTLNAPSKTFFEKQTLQWNNSDGYIYKGKQVFTDTSVLAGTRNSLYVDAEYINIFLKKNKLRLIWTFLGEKLLMKDNAAARQTFSNIAWMDEGKIISPKPFIEIK